MRILFFAWCREQLGTDSLEIPLDSPLTVAQLKQQLADRGEVWRQVFAHTSLLCAVNQTLSDEHTELKDNDEVAFFPPVTRG